MDWTFIAILIVVGLALIAIDFYLPSFVLGSIGAILMVVALVICYKTYGAEWFALLLILEVTLGIGAGYLSIRFFPHTKLGSKMILNEMQKDTHTTSQVGENLIGQKGIAQTTLRPIGIAILDGKRLDAVAEAGMIEAGSNIKVVSVQNNNIVVRKI